MRGILAEIPEIWGAIISRVTLRRDRSPIDSVALLNEFVSTRSAFIAQKTLYGYLKTRIGTRYPSMFEDDVFVDSINIAKLHVFAACLSDLTIHAIARATQKESITDDTRRAVAGECFRAALAENSNGAHKKFSNEDCTADFSKRLDDTDWSSGALGRENFTRSPAALVKWAPIAPELKKYDSEIVANSIKFAWQDIRKQLDQRLDAGVISAELATD